MTPSQSGGVGPACLPPDAADADTRRLVHELRTHQIELEAQNAELRRVQLELEASRDRFRNLYEHAPVGFATLSVHGAILDANLAAATLLGVTRDALRGQALASFLAVEDAYTFERHRRATIELTAPQQCEVRLVCADGATRIVRLESVVPTVDDVTIRVALIDVTVQRQAEAEVLESHTRFEQMAERIADVFYLRDAVTGATLYVSPAYETIWGRPSRALYDHPSAWVDAIHPDDAARVRDHIAAARDLGPAPGTYDHEYRVVRPDETVRWVRDRAYAVLDERGRAHRLAGIAQDVTERRQLEVELREAQKMEAIGLLTCGVSHDFNNLLMGISGCASVALNELEPDSPARALVDEIRTEADGGSALTRQLLDVLRKPGPEDVVESDLDCTVAKAGKVLRRLVGAGIEVMVDLDAPRARVCCSEAEINQILMNLTVNARDAMPQGGRLTIGTRRSSVREPDECRRFHVSAGEYLTLTVTDTGMGIGDEMRTRIFEPFFTTKPVGSGSGLGLSTVYWLVEQRGGHISLTSEPGEGTAVAILLPRTSAPRSKRPVASRPPVIEPTTGRTILMVEDEALIRMTLSYQLEAAGYCVLEAGCGDEGLRICREHEGPIDVLLTDMAMPGIGGSETARMAVTLRPDLRVIYMSGHSAGWLVEQGRIEPDAVTLQKPFEFGALLSRIEDVLRGMSRECKTGGGSIPSG